jgi:hypothetical protein
MSTLGEAAYGLSQIKIESQRFRTGDLSWSDLPRAARPRLTLGPQVEVLLQKYSFASASIIVKHFLTIAARLEQDWRRSTKVTKPIVKSRRGDTMPNRSAGRGDLIQPSLPVRTSLSPACSYHIAESCPLSFGAYGFELLRILHTERSPDLYQDPAQMTVISEINDDILYLF